MSKIQILTDSTNRVHDDSIQIVRMELSRVNARLDSMGEILNETKIGIGHYSDIIGVQTGIFSLIITIVFALLALVSWGFFVKYVSRKIVKVNNTSARRTKANSVLIAQELEQVDMKIAEIVKKTLLLELRNYEELYDRANLENRVFPAFMWSLKVLSLRLKLKDKAKMSNESFGKWLEKSKSAANRVSKGIIIDETTKLQITDKLKDLEQVESEHTEKVAEIRDLIYSKIYSSRI